MTLGTQPRPSAPGPGFGNSAAGGAGAPQGRRRGLMPVIAGVSLVVGIGVGAIAGVSVAGKDSAAPKPPVASAAPTPALTPAAAKDRVCAVLRSDYESVANAIDGRNRFATNDWSDPALLSATNHLVAVTTSLADSLENSLSSAIPADFRSAVGDYVAALRALGTSQRNHAPSTQLNGVGEFYNQVVDGPLRACGIAS